MPTPAPLVSVIIPTYNRRSVLVTCLQALRSQTIAAELFEVIVIDDGSSDGTAAAVAGEMANWNGRLTYRWQSNAGANTARNCGIEMARGALLVIINDDSITVARFLAEHLRVHEDHPEENVAVLGRMTVSPGLPSSPVADLHLDASYKTFTGRTELDWTAFFTCNISVKKSFLIRHGIFDTSLRWHEDIELGERLSHHGLRVLYNPAALAFHLHYLSEGDYLRIAEKEGKALVQWYLRQPALLDTLVKVGLRTRSFPRRSLRHLAGDLLVNDVTLRAWLWLASISKTFDKSVSLLIYRAIFQAKKRRAISSRLAHAKAAM
jgi:glycosyltransferase involved in cell wall biosynthesis